MKYNKRQIKDTETGRGRCKNIVMKMKEIKDEIDTAEEREMEGWRDSQIEQKKGLGQKRE